MTRRLATAILGLMMMATGTASENRGITRQVWGKTKAGEQVDLYTLTNAKGASIKVATLGGTIVSINVPDKAGKLGDVVLGFDTLDGYLGSHPFFGVLVGRYGNRIGKATFMLDGKTYTLAKNNGENSLHGGLKGFDKYVWKTREVVAPDGLALELTHISPDGDEGYPGTLSVTVRYTWSDANALRIDYAATTDKPTVLNLTNHAYFNLGGPATPTILTHQLTLQADRFTPVDKGLIPTGELKAVAGTPFDFLKPRAIGAGIDADDEQIKFGGGYDHNFVFSQPSTGAVRVVGRVTEPVSGRVVELSTSEPGVQFYTGNFLDGSIKGRGGQAYVKRSGFCLETQHFPDSPNNPAFPSTVLRPGQTYKTSTVYAFSVAP